MTHLQGASLQIERTESLLGVTVSSQVPQPLLLVFAWVYSTLKTWDFFFASFHSVIWGTWQDSVTQPGSLCDTVTHTKCKPETLNDILNVQFIWAEGKQAGGGETRNDMARS